MELAGIPCEVVVSNADETIEGFPEDQVWELAKRKAFATLPLLNGSLDTTAIVIAADTLVSIDNKVLGKPADAQEAFNMLKSLAGKKHTVYTGVTLLKVKPKITGEVYFADEQFTFVDYTDVYFHPLTDEEINEYIKTGEPFDKAGAYGAQERGAVLIERVDGDFYTVVGLPISKVKRALAEMI